MRVVAAHDVWWELLVQLDEALLFSLGLLSLDVRDQLEDILRKLSRLVTMGVISGTNINLFAVSCVTKSNLFGVRPYQLCKLLGMDPKIVLVPVIILYFVVPHFGGAFEINFLIVLGVIVPSRKVFTKVVSFF